MALVSKAFGDIITFTRASTATYFDATGTLQSAAINTPRFDYNPATLAARGFLIEEARTNLLTYSEAFDTTPNWSVTNSTITANTSVSPDGSTTADTITDNVTLGQHQVTQITNVTSGTSYTLSCFVKVGTAQYVRLSLGGAAMTFAATTFDLSTGTVSTGTGTISSVGNSWYRISCTSTASSTGAGNFAVGITNVSGTIYSGVGDTLLIWGAQLEAGAFPTSYIPTTTTALTRSADVASVNTLSPWYNAAASTIYGEWTNLAATMPSGSTQTVSNINDTTGGNQQSLFQIQTANSKASANMFSGGVNPGRLDSGGAYSNATVKAAAAYAALDRAISVNGNAALTSAAGALPISVTRLELGSSFLSNSLNGWLRRVSYFPRRLANAELQSLTS